MNYYQCPDGHMLASPKPLERCTVITHPKLATLLRGYRHVLRLKSDENKVSIVLEAIHALERELDRAGISPACNHRLRRAAPESFRLFESQPETQP